MSNTTKKFVTGATVLAIAGILAKVLSMFFRIPLASDYMLGDEGMAYYQLPYPIYSLLISISYLGLPSAISKLVSERVAQEKYKEAHDIFKNTFKLLFTLGLVSSLFLFFGAKTIIRMQDWPDEALWSIYGLSFAPFFVAIMGAYRGYFQGMQNMVPTAVSQLIESFLRVIAGVGLAAILLKQGLGLAAGGASFGATAGALAGTIFLAIVYFKRKKDIVKNFEKDKNSVRVGFRKVALLVISVALPITLGAAINSVISLIDSGVIVSRLINALGMSKVVAASKYGIFSGKATTLINVPLTISTAVVLSIMPAISEAVAKNDEKEKHDKISLGLRFSILLALPATAGLATLSTPIMQLIYGTNTKGGDILSVLSMCLIFVILGQLFAAILQGIGKFYLPIITLGISAVFKYILTYLLVGVPSLNINGASIATVVTYMIYALLNLMLVKKYAGYKVTNKKNTIIKPIIATVVMTFVAIGSYNGLMMIMPSMQKIVTVLAVAIAGCTYIFTLLFTKAISEEDYLSIPGGDKILKIVKKLKLV